MTGERTLRNWILAGGPELLIKKGMKYKYTNSVTTKVNKGALQWAKGWEFIKGFIGQRIYKP